MKLLRMVFIVLVLVGLLLVVSPSLSVFAQDATVEANPIALVTEEAAAPGIVCEDGAVCTLNEAPDEDEVNDTPSNSVPTPIVVGGSLILGAFFLLFLYNQRQVNELLAKAIPAEAVPALIDAALPTLTTLAMNTIARAIPTEIDDKLFIQAAKDRGLVVVRDDITGDYHTTRQPLAQSMRSAAPYPPATGTPLSTDYTLPKTDTLPNRPDGGASGAGAGFPPVR